MATPVELGAVRKHSVWVGTPAAIQGKTSAQNVLTARILHMNWGLALV